MINRYRSLVFFALSALSLTPSLTYRQAQSKPTNKHVILDWSFDQMTGRPFSPTAKNADTQSYFASVNRLMTAYIALDRLASGQIKESDLVTISKNASSVRSRSIFLKDGKLWPVTQPDHGQAAGYLAAHWGGHAVSFPPEIRTTG